jgi:hypothetical protein
MPSGGEAGGKRVSGVLLAPVMPGMPAAGVGIDVAAPPAAAPVDSSEGLEADGRTT